MDDVAFTASNSDYDHALENFFDSQLNHLLGRFDTSGG